VWNKLPKSELLIDVNDVALGHATKQKWNEPGKWIWSKEPVHEPLVGIEAFERVRVLQRAKGSAGERSPRLMMIIRATGNREPGRPYAGRLSACRMLVRCRCGPRRLLRQSLRPGASPRCA
jgi:hypothetical protein